MMEENIQKKKSGKKKVIFAAVTMVIVLIVAALFGRNMLVSANYGSKYARTFGEFTASTAAELLRNKKENSCYSPVSLFAALSLSAECTEDETQEGLFKMLGVKNIDDLEDMYHSMLADLEVEEMEMTVEQEIPSNSDKPMMPIPVKEPAKITLCNSLWLKDLHVKEETEKITKRCMDEFDAEIFVRDVVEAVEVNNWVSDKTNGLIKAILDSEFDTIRMLSLVNTLYYKAAWEYDFNEINYEGFTLEDGNVVNAEFIECSEETMSYLEEDDYTVVSVPLQEGEMLFVLPDEGMKVDKLLTEGKLNEILALNSNGDMERGIVTITIPEFSIEDEFSNDLERMIRKMGAKKFLSSGSQWSVIDISEGMSDNVSVDVVQKTKIVVDVKGVEAAAATSVSVEYIAAGPTEIDLEIAYDRPFLYVLMKNDVPMFIGTMYNPAE